MVIEPKGKQKQASWPNQEIRNYMILKGENETSGEQWTMRTIPHQQVFQEIRILTLSNHTMYKREERGKFVRNILPKILVDAFNSTWQPLKLVRPILTSNHSSNHVWPLSFIHPFPKEVTYKFFNVPADLTRGSKQRGEVNGNATQTRLDQSVSRWRKL